MADDKGAADWKKIKARIGIHSKRESSSMGFSALKTLNTFRRGDKRCKATIITKIQTSKSRRKRTKERSWSGLSNFVLYLPQFSVWGISSEQIVVYYYYPVLQSSIALNFWRFNRKPQTSSSSCSDSDHFCPKHQSFQAAFMNSVRSGPDKEENGTPTCSSSSSSRLIELNAINVIV